MSCTPESHAALKADPVRWAALRHLGVSTYDLGDGAPAETLDHAVCGECLTTLAVVVEELCPDTLRTGEQPVEHGDVTPRAAAQEES